MLCSVAASGVGNFCIDNDLHSFLGRVVAAEVGAADAVCMAEDRDCRGALDEADELVAAARDAQVDVLVQRQEVLDNIVGLDELQAGWRDGGGS